MHRNDRYRFRAKKPQSPSGAGSLAATRVGAHHDMDGHQHLLDHLIVIVEHQVFLKDTRLKIDRGMIFPSA